MPEVRAIRRCAIPAIAAVLLALAGAANAETVLITGANSGLGLEFTKQYAESGWTVIATHRRTTVPDSLVSIASRHANVRIEQLDVTDTEAAAALARKLADIPIDVLINNAGVYNDRRECDNDDCPGDWSTQNFGNLDYDLFDTIMAVNVKGPLVVTEALIENVRASEQKKIVMMGSTNGSLTQTLGGAGSIFYRASKAALNRAMQLVAESQRASGVTVISIHPGAVLTERQEYLSDFPGMLEMPFSISNMIETIDGLTIEDAGRFINYDGEPAPL